jgi:predicted AlkP superfamily pyrophosphatase or phosphodiesterase
MRRPVVLLSIPALREKDVEGMKQLCELTAGGEIVNLRPGFPAVTCSVQATMTTGRLPREHGVIGNGTYWADEHRVEMWTAPNSFIESPQIWDLLQQHDDSIESAVWFPLHSKESEANYVCTPAPIHNPDGSESLWCYTRPTELYGTLRDKLGDFPLKNFWGPLAGIQGSTWIVDSAIYAAENHKPSFFYIYLPHLDYAPQKFGPDSREAAAATQELDQQIGRLGEGLQNAYGAKPLWVVAGEYTITPVDHCLYPNRILRGAGFLKVEARDGAEYLDLEKSRAFAMCDHQFSHIYLQDKSGAMMHQIVSIFEGAPGIDQVLVGPALARYGLDHRRSGDIVLVSSPNSWQAYYWWLDDKNAPPFARTVDIHRKPGYDPVELFFDPATRSIPLDASLVRGSHGAPALDPSQETVAIASEPGLFDHHEVDDRAIFDAIMRSFGLQN